MEWHFVYTFEKWFFKRLNREFFSSLVSKFHFIGSRTFFFIIRFEQQNTFKSNYN